MLASVRDADASGAARRRQRRLRQWLRHKRLSVAMALAENNHHSPTMARAREEEKDELLNATGQKTPPSTAASTVYFSLDDDGDDRLYEVRPQDRVLRRTVEQNVDAVTFSVSRCA